MQRSLAISLSRSFVGQRRLLASKAAAASSVSAGSTGAKPREPTRVRSDNAPLYEQMRRERAGATKRVALENRRSDLRRRQIEEASADEDKDSPRQRLQSARVKRAELPPNCLAWSDYALFADAPRIRPLKSLDEDSVGGSFASLLRRSSFVELGNFENRIVCGRVFERYEGNLYIDFGGKFHAVCPAPRVNNDKYVRGAQVMLRLIDPEMTSRFLGSERHVTLGEADAVLLGLRPAAPGETADMAASIESESASFSDKDRASVDADTVSPLRLSLMRLALLEEAEAQAAAADEFAMMNDTTIQTPKVL